MSYRQLLQVKLIVYATPLVIVALLLTVFANLILDAPLIVWAFTIPSAAIMAVTLVALGIGMGALSPNFDAENPLQVGLSLGGFAYMAVSMAYVGSMMLLAARPIMQYFFWRMFGVGYERPLITAAVPIIAAIAASSLLSVLPMLAAEKRLARLEQSR